MTEQHQSKKKKSQIFKIKWTQIRRKKVTIKYQLKTQQNINKKAKLLLLFEQWAMKQQQNFKTNKKITTSMSPTMKTSAHVKSKQKNLNKHIN